MTETALLLGCNANSLHRCLDSRSKPGRDIVKIKCRLSVDTLPPDSRWRFIRATVAVYARQPGYSQNKKDPREGLFCWHTVNINDRPPLPR